MFLPSTCTGHDSNKTFWKQLFLFYRVFYGIPSSLSRIQTRLLLNNRQQSLNRKLLFEGDLTEIDRTVNSSGNSITLPPEYFSNITEDCQFYRMNRSYIMSSLSKDEKHFPIAFTIAMYRDVAQSERLLRAIYRPQNYYCIHVDAKSPDRIHKAIQGIASCFPNVFISSRSVRVKWGEYSVLEQDLICMQDLMKFEWRWVKMWKIIIK